MVNPRPRTQLGYPKTAVVLSGGEGVRLRPLTNDIPKGLVFVAGKPLLQWVIEWLKANQISRIVLGVAYLKEKIMDYFGNGERLGVEIAYSVHTVEGGTGEGFRLAVSRFIGEDSFFALNGDQVTDLQLPFLFRAHHQSHAIATIVVVHPRLPFGLVLADQCGFCTGFVEKPLMRDTLSSSGIYVFDRRILGYLPKKGDVEKTVFPRLARERRLKAYTHRGLFLTVNSLRELEEADMRLRRWRKRTFL